MHVPFFSIVIPALDEEKTLPKLLSDLTQQTLSSFEVFVVDGGSRDKTCAVVKELNQRDSRFHCIVSPQKNVSVQRNLGAQQAKGEQLLFLDADTRIPHYYLEGVHYNLMKESADGWSTLSATTSKRADEELFIKIQNFALEGGALLKIPYAIGASVGIKRSFFEKIGGFDETITFGEDIEIVRRVKKFKGKFAIFKDPLYIFNMRRYRKEGTINLTMKLVPTYLSTLITDKVKDQSEIYPMNGGSYYRTRKKSTLEFRELQKVIKKIVRSRQKRAQIIVHQLRTFLNG